MASVSGARSRRRMRATRRRRGCGLTDAGQRTPGAKQVQHLGARIMDVETLAMSFRGAERLLIVAVAALCIWLGYKLFQSLPLEHGSGGTLQLPSAKLVMSKVGPGVFFALFGSLVLWQSVGTQLTAPAKSGGAEKAGQIATGAE